MRSLKMLLALAAGPVALGLTPTHASAQIFNQPPPGQVGQYNPPRVGMGSPAYSPYNNLTRPGGAAANYFGTVRPQMDAMRAFNQIQQNQGSAAYGPVDESLYPGGQQPQFRDPASQLTTGHPVSFGNTAQYFPSQTSGRGVGGAGGNSNFGVNNRGTNFGLGTALIGGNVYNAAVNTPNTSILIGPNGPAVINRLP